MTVLDRPTFKLLCAAPHMVSGLWPIVGKMIDDAYAASDLDTPSGLLDELCAGKRLLWIVVMDNEAIAAGITSIFTMRSGRKMCKILESGGERAREWAHLRSEIEAYAKREGCDRVMIEGRPGWARLFPDYSVTGLILEKRI